jgi:cobalt-zinc-cadmium efflux system protein
MFGIRRSGIAIAPPSADIHSHAHVAARTVLLAAALTLVAAGGELLGSWRSGSLFLTADAVHLLAHLGIFAVLLTPAGRSHERREDLAAIGVLGIIMLVALGIIGDAEERLRSAAAETPSPSFMLLALLGLGANLGTAYLFRDPAATRWSFRAALAHELADASVTIVALLGAVAIALFAWRWVDPALTLLVGIWLVFWAGRLLARRVRFGSRAWVIGKD